MKEKHLLLIALVTSILLIFATVGFAIPGASIVYNETALGGNLWQYDYTFNNVSTAGEYLYSVWLDFTHNATVTGSPLPIGWDGTVWQGTNTTSWINTFSTLPVYNISVGSALGGFSFTIDYKASDITYTAYFDNGGIKSSVINTTSIVPEPISSILFVTGGALLGFRRLLRNRVMS